MCFSSYTLSDDFVTCLLAPRTQLWIRGPRILSRCHFLPCGDRHPVPAVVFTHACPFSCICNRSPCWLALGEHSRILLPSQKTSPHRACHQHLTELPHHESSGEHQQTERGAGRRHGPWRSRVPDRGHHSLSWGGQRPLEGAVGQEKGQQSRL